MSVDLTGNAGAAGTELAASATISRRQLLKWAAAGTTATAAAMILPALTGAVAPAAAADPGTPLDTPAATLPRLFGTPTDLACTRPEQAWTRETDGTVHTFDKTQGVWVAAPEHDWAAVIGYGSVYLARWGRPSGRNQLLMVFGAAPPPPSGGSDPQPPPSGGPDTPPSTPLRLASTGFDPVPLSAGAVAAIAVGGALSFRMSRMRTSPADVTGTHLPGPPRHDDPPRPPHSAHRRAGG